MNHCAFDYLIVKLNMYRKKITFNEFPSHQQLNPRISVKSKPIIEINFKSYT